MNDRMYLFGALFGIGNKMETLMERGIAHFGITPRQWYLAAIVRGIFDGGTPTLKETAKAMGTSHQNVKQIALKLVEKDLAELRKDEGDQRVTRIHLNGEQEVFWSSVSKTGEDFRQEVFAGIGDDDLETARKVLETIWGNLERMSE